MVWREVRWERVEWRVWRSGDGVEEEGEEGERCSRVVAVGVAPTERVNLSWEDEMILEARSAASERVVSSVSR